MSDSPRLRSRFTTVIFSIGIAAVVGITAFIVIGLATAQPGAKACDRLDELQAERAVDRLESFVQSRVVRMNIVDGTERVEVSGCRAAMSELSSAMSHKQFTKLVDCIANAKTANGAARCI
jgi:hypothetical protein